MMYFVQNDYIIRRILILYSSYIKSVHLIRDDDGQFFLNATSSVTCCSSTGTDSFASSVILTYKQVHTYFLRLLEKNLR